MKFTLKKRRSQGRDYVLHKTFKLGSASFPDELLFVSPVLDQGEVDECTAYSSVAARWNEINNTNFDPSAFWDDELAFSGQSTNNSGFDIEVPAATAIEKGFVAMGQPLHSSKPSAYFWISNNNGLDLFDSCRQAMMANKYPLIGGVTWMSEWVGVAGGVISDRGTTALGGHCIKIAGWTTANGVLYMVLQNSWGPIKGVNGLYYMTRDIFNQSFNGYGIFQWSDSQNLEIKTLGLINALWQNIKTLLKLS